MVDGRLKNHIFWITTIGAFCWAFSSLKINKRIETDYPKEKYQEDFCKIYYDLGIFSLKRHDLKKATKAFRSALRIMPTFTHGYEELGQAFEQQTKMTKALKSYLTGLTLNPHFIKERFADRSFFKAIHSNSPGPQKALLHNGETLVITTNLDSITTLLFIRFLPQLQRYYKKIYFNPPEEIGNYLKQNEENLGASILNSEAPIKNIYDEITLEQAILELQPSYTELIKHQIKCVSQFTLNEKIAELFKTTKLKVGVCWSPEHTYQKETNRVPLRLLYQFARLKNVQLYALQKGSDQQKLTQAPEDVNIINLAPYMTTTEATAQLIQHCDVIITVDSLVAQLSALQQKPTWLMLGNTSSWYWFGHRNIQSCCWYKNITKFRQNRDCKWSPICSRIKQKLIDLATSHQFCDETRSQNGGRSLEAQ